MIGLRVVKLGGSLLDEPDLPQRLREWLAGHDDRINLVVCGGGAPVEWLRDRAVAQGLNDEAAHWAAIRLMDENARRVHGLMPELPVINLDNGQVPDGNCLGPGSEWFRRNSRLPCTWEVTSDSLAAELAWQLGADELHLLKRCMPQSRQLSDWSQCGFTDSEFARTARGIGTVLATDLIGGHSLLARGF
jgi:aspartokinase-like uncharacterized kinase